MHTVIDTLKISLKNKVQNNIYTMHCTIELKTDFLNIQREKWKKKELFKNRTNICQTWFSDIFTLDIEECSTLISGPDLISLPILWFIAGHVFGLTVTIISVVHLHGKYWNFFSSWSRTELCTFDLQEEIVIASNQLFSNRYNYGDPEKEMLQRKEVSLKRKKAKELLA